MQHAKVIPTLFLFFTNWIEISVDTRYKVRYSYLDPSFIYRVFFIKLLFFLHSHPKTWSLVYFESKFNIQNWKLSHFCVNKLFWADAKTYRNSMKIWKKPSKVEYFSKIEEIFITALGTQLVKLIFSTVYKTGTLTSFLKEM